MFSGDASLVGITILTDANRHDDLFERSVSGTFADAVDGALDLAGSGGDGGHSVGDGHTEIVVAVGGDDNVLDSLDAATDGGDQFAEFGGHSIADSVGNIQRGSAGLDNCFEHLEKKFGIGSGGVFR